MTLAPNSNRSQNKPEEERAHPRQAPERVFGAPSATHALQARVASWQLCYGTFWALRIRSHASETPQILSSERKKGYKGKRIPQDQQLRIQAKLRSTIGKIILMYKSGGIRAENEFTCLTEKGLCSFDLGVFAFQVLVTGERFLQD